MRRTSITNKVDFVHTHKAQFDTVMCCIRGQKTKASHLMHALCVTYIYSARKQSRLSVGRAAQRRGLFIYVVNVMQNIRRCMWVVVGQKYVMHYNMRAYNMIIHYVSSVKWACTHSWSVLRQAQWLLSLRMHQICISESESWKKTVSCWPSLFWNTPLSLKCISVVAFLACLLWLTTDAAPLSTNTSIHSFITNNPRRLKKVYIVNAWATSGWLRLPFVRFCHAFIVAIA